MNINIHKFIYNSVYVCVSCVFVCVCLFVCACTCVTLYVSIPTQSFYIPVLNYTKKSTSKYKMFRSNLYLRLFIEYINKIIDCFH